MKQEKNRNKIRILRFLAFFWVVLLCPYISSAQQDKMDIFLVSQAGGDSIFTVGKDNAILGLEEKEIPAIKRQARKIKTEEVLFLGNLQINPESSEEKGNDVFLASLDRVRSGVEKSERIRDENMEIIDSEKKLMSASADEVWGVGRDVIFGSRVTFEDSADFLSQTTFMGRVMFTDIDMAGSAVIKKGRDKTHITFRNSYSTKPYVTASPNNDFAMIRVDNATEEGFDILVKEKTDKDLRLTWQAAVIYGK